MCCFQTQLQSNQLPGKANSQAHIQQKYKLYFKHAPSKCQIIKYKQSMIAYHDLKSQHGNSGAGMLNLKSQLVGLNLGQVDKDKKGVALLFTRKFHQNFKKMLNYHSEKCRQILKNMPSDKRPLGFYSWDESTFLIRTLNNEIKSYKQMQERIHRLFPELNINYGQVLQKLGRKKQQLQTEYQQELELKNISQVTIKITEKTQSQEIQSKAKGLLFEHDNKCWVMAYIKDFIKQQNHLNLHDYRDIKLRKQITQVTFKNKMLGGTVEWASKEPKSNISIEYDNYIQLVKEKNSQIDFFLLKVNELTIKQEWRDKIQKQNFDELIQQQHEKPYSKDQFQNCYLRKLFGIKPFHLRIINHPKPIKAFIRSSYFQMEKTTYILLNDSNSSV